MLQSGSVKSWTSRPVSGSMLLEEGEQRHGAIARERQAEERVVAPVEQAGHARQRRRLVEAGEQVLEVRIVRVGPEVGVVAVAGEVHALARPGQPGALDQPVVLEEAEEDAAQNPVHRRLGERVVAEVGQGLAGPAGIARRLPLGLKRPVGVRIRMDVAQIRVEAAQQALEVLKQERGINHLKGVPELDGTSLVNSGGGLGAGAVGVGHPGVGQSRPVGGR